MLGLIANDQSPFTCFLGGFRNVKYLYHITVSDWFSLVSTLLKQAVNDLCSTSNVDNAERD